MMPFRNAVVDENSDGCSRKTLVIIFGPHFVQKAPSTSGKVLSSFHPGKAHIFNAAAVPRRELPEMPSLWTVNYKSVGFIVDISTIMRLKQ